jgi:hypothetical protein
MSECKRVTYQDFRNGGLLQEANRQWFHPLGMALAASEGEGGAVVLEVLADDDPEGWCFDWAGMDAAEVRAKAESVARESLVRSVIRESALGWNVQPLPPPPPPEKGRDRDA